jgi:CHAT domain
MPSAVSEHAKEETIELRFRSCARAAYDDRFGKLLDIQLPTDDLTTGTIRFLHRLVEVAGESDGGAELLKVLGRQLFEFVFGRADRKETPHRQRLVQQLKAATDRGGRPVHLRLIFEDEADPLALWPWELLYCPEGKEGWEGRFLRHAHFTIMRVVNAQAEIHSNQPPLTIMLAISEPESSRPDIGAPQITGILTPYQSSKPPRVELKVLEDPDFGELKDKIEQWEPQLFHFHGHGNAQGGLHLARPAVAGPAAPIRFSSEAVDEGVSTNGYTFASLFENHQPNLVLFTACETALSQVRLWDVARQLAETGVPAVVAMQFEVTVDTAARFAEQFYEELVAGELIAPAFSAALDELSVRNAEAVGARDATRAFGTPVLFLGKGNAAGLVIRATDTASSPVPGSTTRKQPKCVFCGFEGVGKYCGECGNPAACPECGKRFATKVKICTNCGRRLGDSADTTPEPQISGAAIDPSKAQADADEVHPGDVYSA